MLKKLYGKSKIWFAVAWIISYCVLMSMGDSLSAAVGLEKSVTLAVGGLLSGALLLFLKKNRLLDVYGLCKSKVPAKKMLYYLPVWGMLTANLWYGVTVNYSAVETALYILSMFAVGILGSTPFVRNRAARIEQRPIGCYLRPLVAIALLLVCTAYLVDGSFNPFLYFRF